MFKNILNKITQVITIAMMLYTTGLVFTVNAQQFAQMDQDKTVSTEQYTGELIKKDNNVLSISKDKEVKEYNVKADIKIKRDAVSSSIDKLQTGDVLSITLNKDTKEIMSIDATSVSIVDTIIKAIPIIIGVLLLVAAAYYLIKKSKKDMIRTTTTNNLNN